MSSGTSERMNEWAQRNARVKQVPSSGEYVNKSLSERYSMRRFHGHSTIYIVTIVQCAMVPSVYSLLELFLTFRRFCTTLDQGYWHGLSPWWNERLFKVTHTNNYQRNVENKKKFFSPLPPSIPFCLLRTNIKQFSISQQKFALKFYMNETDDRHNLMDFFVIKLQEDWSSGNDLSR